MGDLAKAWVAVRAAAEKTGCPESRIRAAYRAGRIEVREDLSGPRPKKLVQLADVRGLMPDVVAVPAPVEMAGVLEQVEEAIDRANRAEQQVVLLRNEVAQLRYAHERVQNIVDRESAERFRSLAQAACAPARRTRSGSGVLRLLSRRTA